MLVSVTFKPRSVEMFAISWNVQLCCLWTKWLHGGVVVSPLTVKNLVQIPSGTFLCVLPVQVCIFSSFLTQFNNMFPRLAAVCKLTLCVCVRINTDNVFFAAWRWRCFSRLRSPTCPFTCRYNRTLSAYSASAPAQVGHVIQVSPDTVSCFCSESLMDSGLSLVRWLLHPDFSQRPPDQDRPVFGLDRVCDCRLEAPPLKVFYYTTQVDEIQTERIWAGFPHPNSRFECLQ